MNMYRFIEVEKAGERSLNRAGAVLEVSRAADDEWRRQQPSRRAQEDQELTEKVRTIFTAPGRRTGRHGSTGRCARRDQVLAQAGGPADGRAAAPGPAPSALEADRGGRPGGDDHRRGPDRAAAPARRRRPLLGGRPHVRADLGGVGRPGHRDRPGLAAGGGRGDGRPPAHGPGLRRPPDGDQAAPARSRPDLPSDGAASTPRRSSPGCRPGTASGRAGRGRGHAGTTRWWSRSTRPRRWS